jgi:hypothetical protein
MQNDWLCPITLSMMRDPVIASDGHSYERDAITQWFTANSTSPKTGLLLTSKALIPNHALRNTIEQYLLTRALPAVQHNFGAFKDAPLTLAATVDGTSTHLRVSAAAEGKRQPIVFIAIVDNSGSMGEVADKTDDGESFGYTRLDLVKHTIRTIAATLGAQDLLSVISYSTSARVVCVPTPMTEEGRKKINVALESVQPDSQTNIYDGIRQAAVIANKPEFAGHNIVGLLLTDGFPNVNPPRGILQTLATMEMKNPWTLHTFGFGYQLDSALLAGIARWGKGLFGFIPDCSMVGTVFINFLANMLSTAAMNATLQYGTVTLQTGPIQFGQPLDFIVPAQDAMPSLNGEEIVPTSAALDPFVLARAAYNAALEKALNESAENAKITLEFFYDTYKDSTDEKVKQLLRDVHSNDPSEGQIGMSPKYFAKWGEHYMRSYLRAQQLQQCMNFKDPGLQIYGGALFREIQGIAEKAFGELPPPIPSSAPEPKSSKYGLGYTPSQTPQSMSIFHSQSGGCFAPTSHVLMADGSRKEIQTLVAGEMVLTPLGPVPITAVVVCGSKKSSQPMSQIDGLCITPWHPIMMKGVWCFPASIALYASRLMSTVYNLVLPKGHVVNVDGFECITLGHGFTEPVAAHPFFGTEKVIKDLERVSGWAEGRPTFVNLVATRDAETGMINGWIDDV